MSQAARLLPIEDDGRVVPPADLREKLGLKQGDSVEAVETPDGVLLMSREAAIERELTEVDADLRKHGVSLDEMIESGREIRGQLVKERYGLGE